MSRWALLTLWRERGGAMASGAGVALAMLLVLYLDAVFRGEADQIVAFIEHTPGQVWVLQDGIENLHMSRSRISDQVIADVRRAVPEARVMPVVYRDILIGPQALQRLAYAVGVSAQGGAPPWQVSAGQARPGPGEVVVPEPLAAKLGLSLGDPMRIGPRRLRIVGLSVGTFSMANPLVYLNEADARDILKVGDGANFVVLDLPGADEETLARRLRSELDDVEVVRRSQLIHSDWRLGLEMGGALIRLMELIALLVSALVVSFASFAFVARRRSELAVARALGATRPELLGAVLLMSLSLAATGVVLAGAVVVGLTPLLRHYVPEVAMHFSGVTYVQVTAAVLVVAVVAALMPALRVARVDPTLVFQA